jgi:acetyltransferase AlgX (SGNH hydrolase-like protein)
MDLLTVIAAAIGALMCLVILGELVLRVRGMASTVRYVWDPDIGLLLGPGQRARRVQPEFRTDVFVNQHGWHDCEHLYTKPPGVTRIVLVGDSFIEATEVPVATTVHRVLESVLNERMAPRRYEVIALGAPATGTATEYVLIKKFALRYHPDIVIVNFFTLNDVSDNLFTLARQPGRPYFRVRNDRLELEHMPRLRWGQRWTILFRLQRLGLYHAAWAFILGWFSRSLDHRTDFAVFSDSSSDFELAWKVTEAALRSIDEIVRAAGARLLVTVTPPKEAIYQDEFQSLRLTFPGIAFDMGAVEKRLAAVLERLGIDHHFLTPDLGAASRSTGARLYWPRDGHWTVTGHREAALSIARKLKTLDISGCPSLQGET